LSVGQEVTIAYRLNGRKWQRDAKSEVKFFVNLEALSVSSRDGAAATEQTASDDAFDQANSEMTYSEEDIPF
jgi:hypothetical protein